MLLILIHNDVNKIHDREIVPIYIHAYAYIYIYTLWLFNIAMENGPFIVDLPI